MELFGGVIELGYWKFALDHVIFRVLTTWWMWVWIVASSGGVGLEGARSSF